MKSRRKSSAPLPRRARLYRLENLQLTRLLKLERLESRRLLSIAQQVTTPSGTSYTLTDAASGGWLEMQAAGSGVKQVIDTNVARFGVDASGAAVALEDTGDLVLFPANSSTREPMLSGIRNFVIDASGTVAALHTSAGSASGTVYRFTPGSAQGQALTGAFSDLVAALGASVALRSDSVLVEFPDEMSSPEVPFAGGNYGVIFVGSGDGGASVVNGFVVESDGSVVALMNPAVGHAVGALYRFTATDSPAQIAGSYQYLALDGKGDAVTLDNSNELWLLASGSDKSQSMATGVSAFVLDADGSIVAFSPATPGSTTGNLFRFAAGLTSAGTPFPAVTLMGPGGAEGSDPNQALQFEIDGSGDLVAIDSADRLVEFAPGSSSFRFISDDIKSFALDGTGTVVALTVAHSNLVRIVSVGPEITLLDSGVLSFAVDSAGQVIALEGNGDLVLLGSASGAGSVERQVMLSSTYSSTTQSWEAVSSFHMDPNGNVVAVIAQVSSLDLLANPSPIGSAPYQIAYFAPGAHPTIHFVQFQFATPHYEPGILLISPAFTTQYVSNVYPLADGSMLVTIKDNYNQFPSNLVVPQAGLFQMFLVEPGQYEKVVVFLPGGLYSRELWITGVSVTNQHRASWEQSEPTVASEYGTTWSYTEPSVVQPQQGNSVGPREGLLLGAGILASVLSFGLAAPLFAGLAESIGLGSTIAGLFGGFVAGAINDALDQGAGIVISGHGSFNPSQILTAGLTGIFGDDGVGDLGSLDGVVVDAGDDALVGNVLETSLDHAADGFVNNLLQGGTLNSAVGQALQGALEGFTGDVADALENSLISSTFLQDASSFLSQASDATSDLPFVNSAVSDFFKDAITNNWSNLSFASFADSGASLIEQIATDNLGDTPFASDAVSLLSNAVAGQLDGTTFVQGALSFLDDAVANQLTDSDLANSVGTFLDQMGATNLTTFANTQFGNGVGTFFEQAISGGLTTSSLAQGLGSFLQQAAGSPSLDTSPIATGIGDFLQQAAGNVSLATSPLASGVGDLLAQAQADGVDLTNSPLAAGLGDYLQQAAQQTGSFSGIITSSFATGVGDFLQQAQADGVDLATSPLAIGLGNFLQEESSSNVADSLSPTFSDNLGAFLQQAVQDGPAFLNSTFAVSVGQFLTQVAGTGEYFADPTVSAEVGALLQQAAQAGTVFTNSTLSADIGSFLVQAAKDSDGLLTSAFMGSTASFLTETVAETTSLQEASTVPTLLGTFLREASQAGNSYARSSVGASAITFLRQSAANNTNFLDPSFVEELERLLPSPITLAFLSQPTGSNAVGGIFSVNVAVSDSNGDHIAGVPVTVSLGRNAADADLRGTVTETTNSQGIAEFSELSVNMPGSNYSLTASDAVSAASSNSFGATATQSQHSDYVTAVYQGVFGRAPDPSGLAYWTKQLDGGTPISNVAESIAHSDEYYANFVIKPDYLKLLGRAADADGVAHWTAQMHNGLTDQQLEAQFAASDEFYKTAGATNKNWIDAVYTLLLGRTADAGGETSWQTKLATGLTRLQVAQGIAGSPENDTRLINDDYFHYLGRAADPQGLAHWLQEFTAGQTNEDVIAGFTGSAEYYKEQTG